MAAAAHCQANGPGPACVRPGRDPGLRARSDSGSDIPADRPPPIIMASDCHKLIDRQQLIQIHIRPRPYYGIRPAASRTASASRHSERFQAAAAA
eukprot:733788-Hanusia_phi.AAC.1